MSIHLKYRPENFESFLGNEGVKELQEMIKKPDHPHCYLFYGEMGCGKTTLARLLGKQFNCDDVIEINSANNRGIDTARQIIENSEYKTISGSNKLFILDEIHQTTKDFQNAMLKILEDTPKHVYFILCTTDENKIIKTVKDRCCQFKVEKLSYVEMMKLLKEIRIKENGKVPLIVLKKITENAKSNRQALILLEQVLNVEDEKTALKMINEYQDEDTNLIDLCRNLLSDWTSTKQLLSKINDNEDVEKIRRMVLSYMQKVILGDNENKALKASLIIENFKHNFFETGKAGLVQACFNIFI